MPLTHLSMVSYIFVIKARRSSYQIIFCLLLASPVTAFSDQYECDKATDDLQTYQSYWAEAKHSQKKAVALEAIDDFERERKTFNSLYSKYMSSSASVAVGVLANQASTAVGAFKYALSKLDQTGVTSAGIFCTGDTIGAGASELISNIVSDSGSARSVIVKMNDTASHCVTRAAAGLLVPGATEVIALEELYLNLHRNYTLAKDRTASLTDFKKGLDRIEIMIKSYEKSASYHQFMEDQHYLVENGLRDIKGEACKNAENEHKDAIDDLDDLIFGDGSVDSPPNQVEQEFDFVQRENDVRVRQEANERGQETKRRMETERQDRLAHERKIRDQQEMQALLNIGRILEERSNSRIGSSDGGNYKACLSGISKSQKHLVGIGSLSSPNCSQAKAAKRAYTEMKNVATHYCKDEPEYEVIIKEANLKIRWANDTISSLCVN